MKKLAIFSTFLILLFIAPQFATISNGQSGKGKPLPTDQYLLELSKKYVKTPIKKIIHSDGEVYLQRDLNPYLQANIEREKKANKGVPDVGHDHKEDQLNIFLNRPQPSVAAYIKYFNEAANEFKVPAAILKAAGQVQSNWAQVGESMYGSWGVMGLIENHWGKQITKAAGLLNVSTDAIKNDARTNIRAAAALLASYQKGKATTKLEDWFDAVQDLTGLSDKEMKYSLAQRIFEVINDGSKSITLWNEIIRLDPISVTSFPDYRKQVSNTSRVAAQATDYTLAIPNFTTCNFNARPAGSENKYYFIHYVATGTYQGAINWFKDCSSQVSAHYIVKNSNGEVSQIVNESMRAWAQGDNDGNNQGIGVEHEVLTTNLAMWDSKPMLAAAGNLGADVCDRNGIPRVRRAVNGDRGIYGHSDVRATLCPNLTEERWDTLLLRIANGKPGVATPFLNSVINPGAGNTVTVNWEANREATLKGYRLYYANDDLLTSWSIAADESTLTPSTTSVTLNPSQFLTPPSTDVYHFKISAVIVDGTEEIESATGDVYSSSSNTDGQKVLIVDGFYKSAGSYMYPNHSFVTNYMRAVRDNGNFQISSASNERVADGTIDIKNYDIVIWFIGDESSAGVTLDTREKNVIKAFLENGGKLIFSGAETGYNLGRSGSAAADLPFYNNYFKSTYVADGALNYSPATGLPGTPFEGLVVPFGITYVEDYPDANNGINGGINMMRYNVANMNAVVGFKGKFGTSSKIGGVLNLGFTLETARDSSMKSFIGRAIDYFNSPYLTLRPTANDDIASANSGMGKTIYVLANDANNGTPLKPSTVAIMSNPTNGNVTVTSTGEVVYISNQSFTGTDSFTYTVMNEEDQVSNVANVTVTVIPAAEDCDPNAPESDENHPKRDLRGAWVSSVSNIDWPSSRTLTTQQQQESLIKILDTLLSTGINTVFLQIRPEGDALYQSSIEPWSYWLTNQQGTAPSPLWDPLEFAINEAHKRGMELHAWINPYRAKQSTPTLASNHAAVLHPDWTFVSGTATYFNPGMPQVRQHVANVVADIAKRYEIDGIHFDDYFYPYAGMTGQDDATFANYNPTNIATIADWRRNNVNLMIAKVYDTLQAINVAKKSNIIFGVSPFGIWKSGVPAGITGTSSYDAVYCDPIAWMQAGKVDYIAPQLYWKITGAQDYLALSKWWNDQAKLYNRHVYPGLALYKMTDANNWLASEIENQIAINRRGTHDVVKGQILFSTQQIMNNSKGIKTALQENGYRYKAFSPSMPWRDAVCPNPPRAVRIVNDSLKWNKPFPASDNNGTARAAGGGIAKKYVVYKFSNQAEAEAFKNDGKKIYAITYSTGIPIPEEDLHAYFIVTALDNNNNESKGVENYVLPVTGLSITATLKGNNTEVNWSTLSEINTKEFEVERSTDGVRFQTIAVKAAVGNTNSTSHYTILDELTAPGTYFYRVKSIDLDGKMTFSEIKSVVYGNTATQMVVGPNPFTNRLTLSNLNEVSRVDVIDMAGRIVISRNVKNESTVTLETGHLASGVYNLKVSKTDGSFNNSKVVKQ